MIRLIESSSAQLRLQEARAFVETHAARGDVWLVGASRGAVDDLRAIDRGRGRRDDRPASLQPDPARRASRRRRFSRRRGWRPSTYLGSEAVAARATFDAQRDAALHYFAPVAQTPGFPRALARTLQELRLAEVDADRLESLPLGGPDLAALLERFDEQFAAAQRHRSRDAVRRGDAGAAHAESDAAGGSLLLLTSRSTPRSSSAFVALMSIDRRSGSGSRDRRRGADPDLRSS